jgi:hypothetical protein
MAKGTFRGFAPPDDPMYSEGPRSYSPRWAHALRTRKTTSDGRPTEPPVAGKAPPAKDVAGLKIR